MAKYPRNQRGKGTIIYEILETLSEGKKLATYRLGGYVGISYVQIKAYLDLLESFNCIDYQDGRPIITEQGKHALKLLRAVKKFGGNLI